MCSFTLVKLTVLCLSTVCLSESATSPQVESDDVEVFQKIVLPPVLTRKDSEAQFHNRLKGDDSDVFPEPKSSKLYSSYSWNLPKISGKHLSEKYATSWTDRNNPGNEVPTWGEFSVITGTYRL